MTITTIILQLLLTMLIQVCFLIAIHLYSPNYFMTGLKSTKKKPSVNLTRSTAIKASHDELSSTASDLSESDDNQGKPKLNDINSEDSDMESDDDFGVMKMTKGDAQQIFDEVMSFFFNVFIWLCVLI